MKHSFFLPIFILTLVLTFPFSTFGIAKSLSFTIHDSNVTYDMNTLHCGLNPQVCELSISGKANSFPLGNVRYTGTTRVQWSSSSPNGKGGYCAPTNGSIRISNKFGAIDATFSGMTCDSLYSSEILPHGFTGTFSIHNGEGRYRNAQGSGELVGGNVKKHVWFNAQGNIMY